MTVDLQIIRAEIDGEIVLYGLPARTVERLRLKLSLANPKYVSLKRFHGHAGGEPERIYTAIEMPDGSLHCPRGCIDLIKTELLKDDLVVKVARDGRRGGAPITVRPKDYLPARDYQQEGVDKIRTHTQGLIVLPCVAGDTMLSLNRGGKGFCVSIRDAFLRSSGRSKGHQAWDPAIPTFIRSKVGGAIRLTRVINFVDKGWHPTVRLSFANGARLECTHDHEILTEHGFIAASALALTHRVFFDGARPMRERQPKPSYRRLSWYPSHPFARSEKNQRAKGGRQHMLEEHRAVAEAALNGMTIEGFRKRCKSGDVRGLKFVNPKTHHVHHKDGDATNNAPENLEILLKANHHRAHAPLSHFIDGYADLTSVIAIEEGDVRHVFDVMVEGPHHNFCANGIVVHNCGTGKTKLGGYTMLALRVTTIVLVHTTDLADQWLADFAAFGVDAGLVGSGRDERDRDVVVAIVDSVLPILEADPAWGARFGFAILDECHHAPADTFQRAMRLLPARWRMGLTATPTREDGLTRMVEWTFGRTLLERETKEMIALGYLMAATIEIIATGFTWPLNAAMKAAGLEDSAKTQARLLVQLEEDLATDLSRNVLIADRVADEAKKGETCLVLVRTRAHAKELAEMIVLRGVEARALTGRVSKKKRKGAIDDLRGGTLPVVVATSLADEGLDLPRLSLVGLASPQRARGTTVQRLGRLLRLWDKKPRLLDWVDDEVDCLASRAVARRRVYKDTGLLIQEAT